MGLAQWIIRGLGWELGKEAAQEGIAAVRKRGEPEAPPTPREQRRRAREAARVEKERARAAAKAEKERAGAEERAEKAIDAELAALKKEVESSPSNRRR